VNTLNLLKTSPFTNQMEVETYTWEVLPEGLKLGIVDSIEREMNWALTIARG